MKHRLLTTTLGAGILSGAAALMAADPLPYGHKDFVPTPERPIYFRAGNGEYPGATPPLEWWEGTPTSRTFTYKKEGVDRQGQVIDFADTKSKNILWKMPVPGWSLSHPIVVSNRVFAVGEPDFVTCWDLNTGKQLWQRRMMPLLLDGLPEEKAIAGQKVLDLARALALIGVKGPTAGGQADNLYNGGFNTAGEPLEADHAAFIAKKRAMAGKLIKIVETHRPDVVAFGDEALVKAIDADLALLKRYETVADLAAFRALVTEKFPGKHDPLRSTYLVGACAKRLGVGMIGSWWGYVGNADSTLASDGRRIYGVFDQGQVFALDLDGKLVWGKREKGTHDNRGTFHSPPLLCGGLLLVRDLQPTDKIGHILRALEVETGKQRWEIPFKRSNYGVPRLMRLGQTDVLIGEAPEQVIIRVSDGKQLGVLPKHDLGRGALMSICGDPAGGGAGVVTWSSASDTGGGPSCSYRLRLEGPDQVVAEKLFVLGEKDRKERIFPNQQNFPTLFGTSWLYGNKFFDVVTGKQVSQLPVGAIPECAVMAGRYLIGVNDLTGPHGRKRDDRKAMVRFSVVDMADPAQPKLVSHQNYLGYQEPPADIIVRTYFKEFDPYSFAGCYLGTPSYATEHMSGPVPHGNKLLVQTSAYLYCIGEK